MLDNLSEALYIMEDFIIFRDLQIKKYSINNKSKLRQQTPEWDVIIDIIREYWCDLLATGYLNSKSQEEKLSIFDSVTIIFPYNTIPATWLDGIDYVDFASF